MRTCGALEALVDPNGNRTRWERDVQGRVTKEIRANGSEIVYAYETMTSRLKTMTDVKAQVTTYSYDKTGALTGLVYTNEQHATPDVTFAFESAYGRLVSMVDGTGTTTYSYHPTTTTPQLGAGQLKDVDGPLSNDVIAYTYDELGRVVTRSINGSANTVTWAFDALGRVTSEANVVGTFSYTYDGTSPRLATVTYPNSQTSTYAYFGASGNHRLQTIHHKYPNTSTLSKFDYTYDAAGNILTWRQQADATAVMWEYGYDTADQLVSAMKKSTEPTPQVLQRFAYTYDPAGNRTAEQIDDAITTSVYNNMNQLVSQTPGGLLRFEGTLNEPAAVTIGGKPATVLTNHRFVGHAPVGTGTSQIEIRAIDPNGNVRTNTYEVSQSGSVKTFTYDANGNMTSDGGRSFEWDALNQLTAAVEAAHRTTFTYDSLKRRTGLVEEENAVTIARGAFVWCGMEMCEARVVTGTFEGWRAFDAGEQVGTQSRFFTRDHLGSVRAVSQGTSVLAHYEFDPWGRRSVLAGSDSTDVAFTGHRVHDPSALMLTMFRAYDTTIARWLSQDPASHAGGLNLYGYVDNNPLRNSDPYGLAPWDTVLCWWHYPKCKRSAETCAAELRKRDMLEVLLENNCVSWGGTRCQEMFCGEQVLREVMEVLRQSDNPNAAARNALEGCEVKSWRESPLEGSCHPVQLSQASSS